jgi:hypothetical protein
MVEVVLVEPTQALVHMELLISAVEVAVVVLMVAKGALVL